MAIEAPISKHKKNNLKIYIIVCIVFALWFGYDGYFNEKFKQEHKTANGKPDSTFIFNQKSPPFLIGAAALLGAYLFAIRKKKITADETELALCNKKRIPYDSIQKINKTHFDSKGSFVITYKDKNGSEVNLKITDKKYDNLKAILDELVAKIS